MIDDECEVSSSQVAVENPCESADRDEAYDSPSAAATHSRSEVEVEIKEAMHSDDSDITTTLVVRDRHGRTGAGSKSQWASLNDEKLSHPCFASDNFNVATHEHHTQCKSKNYEFNRDLIDNANSQAQSIHQEHRLGCKSCCKEGLYSPINEPCERFSGVSILSDSCLQTTEQPPTNTVKSAVLSDIPRAQEFVEQVSNPLDDITENMASCQISSGDNFDTRGGGTASASTARLDDSGDKAGSVCREDSQEGESLGDWVECVSGSESYNSLLLGHGMPVSRSSFTKDFIHKHDGTKRLRNNSIAILETKPRVVCYFERLTMRRQTFPGPSDSPINMEEDMSSCDESFSSGTLSPFFLQSLPPQSGRLGRLNMEDDRAFPLSEDSRKSSEGSSGCKASSGNYDYGYGHNGRCCFYPRRAGEDQEETTSSSGQDAQHEQVSNRMTALVLAAVTSPGGDSYSDEGDPGNKPLERSKVAGRGFDGETPEAEGLRRGGLVADDLVRKQQRDSLIKVTHLSRSCSEERLAEDNFQSTILREGAINPKPNQPENIASSDFEPDRRKGLVSTGVIGGCEQRSIQDYTKPPEIIVSVRKQRELSSAMLGAASMSAQDTEEKEVNGHSKAFGETELATRRSLTVEPRDSIQSLARQREMTETSGTPAESQAGTKFGSPSQPDASKGPEDKDSANVKDVFTAPTDVKAQVKEHRRPSLDLALKDREDTVDHWAKRRKVFKEGKQRGSAGGSSHASNVTEESDEARSADMAAHDMEDRGFYTETFHSAAWIYRGAVAGLPSDRPCCLNTQVRPTTVRERTVRIGKGAGGHPLGFRIQSSKPIVVTEVDTNDAAEEAGLLVGDTILAVNGTDVTGLSHSEAMELAKQGSSTLTLTVGSDISRYASTPRPECRGYLYKRTHSGLLRGWRKRWFVLKHDSCLYYYRCKRDEGKICAFPTIKLEGAVVGPDTSLGRPFVFKCSPVSCARVYYFCAESSLEMKRWLAAMDRAVQPPPQNHVWIDVARHNSGLPPLAIKSPECLGLLHQQEKDNESWEQHYCVLKDGCLYFYAGIRSTHANGGIFLHGYTVGEQTNGSRCYTIQLKPPSEEFKSFYLYAENTTETKRWISAIKASISEWVLLHRANEGFTNRSPEDTRM